MVINREQYLDDLWLADSDPLPAFPTDAIPNLLCRQMVKEVSEKLQLDAGFVACCELGAISTAAQGKIQVDLLTHKEHANIYLAGVLESGERKSPAAKLLWNPIWEFELQMQREAETAVNEGQNERTIQEIRLNHLQKSAAISSDIQKAESFKRLAEALSQELLNNPAPTLPYFVVSDVTSEKLAVLMEQNNGKMGILSSEGGIFDIIAGLYNDGKSNIDIFLQSYSHDPISVQRIGRPPVHLPDPSLVVCLALQPSVLDQIRHNPRFKGRGMLARFLFARCEPRTGDRPRLSKGPDTGIVEAYSARIRELMSIEFQGAVLVGLEPEAQALFDKFCQDIEMEMRWGGKLNHLKDWGNKLPGNMARLAAIFHFFQYGRSIADHPVSVNIVSAACVIGLYFLEHAAAIFREINEPENVKSAKKIMNFIGREKPTTFSGRDVMRHSNCKDMKVVEPGIQLLIDRKIISTEDSEENDKAGPGRPKATQYRVNPEVYEIGVLSISSVGNKEHRNDLMMEYKRIMDGYHPDNIGNNRISDSVNADIHTDANIDSTTNPNMPKPTDKIDKIDPHRNPSRERKTETTVMAPDEQETIL